MKKPVFVYHVYQNHRRPNLPQAVFRRMRDAKKFAALYVDGVYVIRRWPAAEAKSLLDAVQAFVLPESVDNVLGSDSARKMAATCLIDKVYADFETASDAVFERRKALQRL